MDEKQKLIDNTAELLKLKKHNSIALFNKSLSMFSVSRKRTVFLAIMFLLIFVCFKVLLFQDNMAISIMADLTVVLNGIIIPIFAVIVTGYAIFQALANGKTLITLIAVKHQDKSTKFEVYNLYFFGIGIWYLIIISLNFILLVIFRYLPEDWHLIYFHMETNETISAALISFYIIFILYFLIEIKSFIFNLFQVFITNSTSTVIEAIENEKNKE